MPDPTASNVVTGQPRVFLFLQGPLTPFFRLIADGLEQRGHRTLRINLWFGDWLHWRRPGATNYRGRLGDWPAFITDYLDREKVTDVLLLGEQRAYHAAAIAAAKERGIQVVATDFGYLRPDWITFERDGMSAASQFPRDPSEIRALAQTLPAPDLQPRYTDDFWNMVRLDMIYHLSGSLMRPLYPFYRSHQVHHPILVYIGTGLHLLRTRLRRRRAEALVNQVQDGRAPYFVFPLQLQNDFQIRAYSPYPRLESAIREVLSSFAGNAPENSRLVIKEHPLDPAIINWRRVCQRVADEVGIGYRVVYLDG
jgi:capsular polysaccharide export protein